MKTKKDIEIENLRKQLAELSRENKSLRQKLNTAKSKVCKHKNENKQLRGELKKKVVKTPLKQLPDKLIKSLKVELQGINILDL